MILHDTIEDMLFHKHSLFLELVRLVPSPFLRRARAYTFCCMSNSHIFVSFSKEILKFVCKVENLLRRGEFGNYLSLMYVQLLYFPLKYKIPQASCSRILSYTICPKLIFSYKANSSGGRLEQQKM